MVKLVQLCHYRTGFVKVELCKNGPNCDEGGGGAFLQTLVTICKNGPWFNFPTIPFNTMPQFEFISLFHI